MAQVGRDAWLDVGIQGYKNFISALLDITDNTVGGVITPPDSVVRYDDDDPYLVVAADKGTATFADIASQLAISRGFWLGDAFAANEGFINRLLGLELILTSLPPLRKSANA